MTSNQKVTRREVDLSLKRSEKARQKNSTRVKSALTTKGHQETGSRITRASEAVLRTLKSTTGKIGPRALLTGKLAETEQSTLFSLLFEVVGY